MTLSYNFGKYEKITDIFVWSWLAADSSGNMGLAAADSYICNFMSLWRIACRNSTDNDVYYFSSFGYMCKTGTFSN